MELFTCIVILIAVFFTAKQDNSSKNLPTSQLPIQGEKLLVLGPEIQEYLRNRMAGPFVNWELAKPLLNELNSYKNVIIVQEYFEKDQPVYIYDSAGYFSKIEKHLPSITQQYVLVSPKLYKKK